MPERVSSLGAALAPRTIGPAEKPGIRLTERRIGSIWQVSAWPDRLAEAGSAAAAAAGADAVPGPGQSVSGGEAQLVRTEPLKWLIVAERDLARPALDPACGTVLDLSHARTVIRVEGADAADLMARLLPIDMRPVSFPEGSVATAGLHHVGVTVLAREGGFDLLVPQTFARSLFEHVVEIAAQFGVAIG